MKKKSPRLYLFFAFSLICASFLGAQDSRLMEDLRAGAPDIGSQAAVLLDAATGTLLYAKNPYEEIPPASLTKLMTIHIALEEVAAGRARLDEIVPLPRESWASASPPRSSKMFLDAGQIVTLRELILGMAIPSGNDAAAATALRFAPTIEDFAARMNAEARRFGLSRTRFVEPSGISEYNMTCALDYAVFCREYLRLHPETVREYHSVPEFAYPKAANVAEPFREKPGTIVQRNRNGLLGRVEGVDGLKTGYIDEAGHNIALTAERGDTRLVAVILGATAELGGDRIRDIDGERLLEWGFLHFKTLRPAAPELSPARIWKGKNNLVPLVPSGNLEFTVLKERGNALFWETEAAGLPLIAPLPAGSEAGSLVLYDETGELGRIPLVTTEEAEAGNILKRFWDSIRLFFRALFKAA